MSRSRSALKAAGAVADGFPTPRFASLLQALATLPVFGGVPATFRSSERRASSAFRHRRDDPHLCAGRRVVGTTKPGAVARPGFRCRQVGSAPPSQRAGVALFSRLTLHLPTAI